MPGQVIIEKRNGYKEMLNKAALDKSKAIAAEGIVSWSAARDGKRISLPDTKRS